MKDLGEAAVDVPGLSPAAASLLALARPQAADSCEPSRLDPAAVLLLLRAADGADRSCPAPLQITAALETALSLFNEPGPCWIDWKHPGARLVYQACLRQAQLAKSIAQEAGDVCLDRAWEAALLAPLGWLAICAVDPSQVLHCRDASGFPHRVSAWQQEHWGLDHAALVRRLCRVWRLPSWLGGILGNLGLPVGIAQRLAATPRLFQVVQLAVALSQQQDSGLGLSLGASAAELIPALNLTTQAVEDLSRKAWLVDVKILDGWQDPRDNGCIQELLHLALENCRLRQTSSLEPLHQEVDQLHKTLQDQCAEEKERLKVQKLAALAELAAGAGHEINNPLAVISGQAQYALKHLHHLEVPAGETRIGSDLPLSEGVPSLALDLARLSQVRTKVAASLNTIIQQTQRIHHIVTDLMQFARPATPKPQWVDLGLLAREVAQSLQELAEERQVRLVIRDAEEGWGVQGDRGQLRIALDALIRNAVEAAPAEGWAGIRLLETAAGVELVVEDNGPGLSAVVQEHLFDPFFSGRNAGRGRGLGLPVAWRLAREHGGDVRFDGWFQGVTRFVLGLPGAAKRKRLETTGEGGELKSPAASSNPAA